MAIDYTELFTDIGKNVKATNEFFDFANSAGLSLPNIDALLSEIQLRYESSDLRQFLQTIEARYQSYRDTSSSWSNQEADQVQLRMLDRDTVVIELSGADIGDIDRTIREIFRDMLAKAQTLNESAITLGAPFFDGDGNGGLTRTTILDGISEPSPGFGNFLLYRGVESSLAVPSETMSLTCIADEDSDGTPEAQEIFLWEGEPANNGNFGNLSEGSGISVQLSTVQSFETIVNRNFEAWANNIPTNWIIELGVAGTDVVQETEDINVHIGESALKLVGNGSNIVLFQDLPGTAGSFLVPDQRLNFITFVKTIGVTTGTLTLRLESPSGEYVASATEEIVLLNTELQTMTNYQFRNFEILLPSNVPEDMRVVIRYEGSPSGQVFVDSIGFGQFIYANGIGLSIAAGSNAYTRNDRFTFSVDNVEGVFSQFYRRRFQFQLPQSTTPTIPDSLAQ